MAQLSILKGIYTDNNSDVRVALPRNFEPVPMDTGASSGYLRPADGIVQFATGPGIDRGGICWNSELYRVMGNQLVRIAADGAVTPIGVVGGAGPVSFDYSFTHLGIASGGRLYLYDGATLAQVTDIDLGTCVDFIWVDGYFMSTDGEFLVVTELADPFTVNPLKYGSSEADPDPIIALLKLRNEVYAVNRFTVEVFNNIGGTLFPFQRVEGAQAQRGAVGTHAACIFAERVAFIGSGRNEAIAIWLTANGMTEKISTREIEQLINELTEAELAEVVIESRLSAGQNLLYVHLPERTVVFNLEASKLFEEHIWYTVDSGMVAPAQYRAKHFVRCYDKWIAGDPQSAALGYLVENISSHYGSEIGWEFSTRMIYNGSKGLVIHALELVALTGRAALGDDPFIATSYSVDGMTWSTERSISAGKVGDRTKRLVWRQQGALRHFRIQRFRGTSKGHLSFLRLETQAEPLAW